MAELDLGSKGGSWTTETLKDLVLTVHYDYKAHVETRIELVERLCREACVAADLRYQQRFEAQEKALSTALTASDRAVAAAFTAADKAIGERINGYALAITKAEQAQAMHNASQNEWRATVTDLTHNIAERARRDTETAVAALGARTEVANKALTEKIEQLQKIGSEKIDAITHRIDRAEGRSNGFAANMGTIISVIAVVAAVCGVAIAYSNSYRIAQNTQQLNSK